MFATPGVAASVRPCPTPPAWAGIVATAATPLVRPVAPVDHRSSAPPRTPLRVSPSGCREPTLAHCYQIPSCRLASPRELTDYPGSIVGGLVGSAVRTSLSGDGPHGGPSGRPATGMGPE